MPRLLSRAGIATRELSAVFDPTDARLCGGDGVDSASSYPPIAAVMPHTTAVQNARTKTRLPIACSIAQYRVSTATVVRWALTRLIEDYDNGLLWGSFALS